MTAATTASAVRLRLTLRGRRVLAAILLLPLVIGLGASLAQIPSAFADSGTAVASNASEQFEWHTIKSGETLWSIAESIPVERDVRDVLDEIMLLNGLSTASVQAGQKIALPNL